MTEELTVLLADDELIYRELVAEILRREHVSCVATGDGLSALSHLETDAHFDVFICDIVMDGNEDLAIVQTARTLRPEMPIILMTGYPSVSTAVASVRMSVADYLFKPLKPEELLTAVRRVTQQKSMDILCQSAVVNLHNWATDVDSIQQRALQNEVDSGDAFYRYMDLTLRNMAGCIADLHSACERAKPLAPETERSPCRFFNCSQIQRTASSASMPRD